MRSLARILLLTAALCAPVGIALRKDSGETPIRLTVTNRNNFSTMFKIRISARPLNGGGDGL